jgi:serine/threonine protein kinase
MDQPDETKLRDAASAVLAAAPSDAQTLTARSPDSTAPPRAGDPAGADRGQGGGRWVGRILGGRYLLQRKLGAGGMGVVYLAADQQVEGETFAVKLLRQEIQERPESLDLVREEVRKTRLLAHPNIVGVYSVNVDQGDVFILMEYLQGKPLSALLDEDFARGMPFGRAWPLIQDMCTGLAHAHDRGVVHSDLKPSNVFVEMSGRAKLLDFGIARASRGDPGHFDPATWDALTPAYASCGMLEGAHPDQSDDVYSVACVIYEMLSGKRPFATASAVEARREGLKADPIHSLTAGQNAALARALSFDAATRTRTVEALLAELNPAAAGRSRRLGLRALAMSVLALLVIAGVIIASMLWRSPGISSAVDTTSGTPPPANTRKVAASKALRLLHLLGIEAPPIPASGGLEAAAVLELLKTAARQVTLGSSSEQIDAALALCRHYSTDCRRDWFTDEAARSVVLHPYTLDPTSVSVRDFQRFVAASGYRTDAESSGVAYRAVDGRLTPVKGGSWKNAVGASIPAPDMAVVGVDYKDAETYCRSLGKRLPTEDEREYAARGPEGHVYPWGDDVGPAAVRPGSQPRVTDGPAEGIAGAFRGLSGSVWEWADTEVDGRKLLKGASWLESNPANKRAAVRGYELADRANGGTGFRCARSTAQWPDAEYWMSRVDSL